MVSLPKKGGGKKKQSGDTFEKQHGYYRPDRPYDYSAVRADSPKKSSSRGGGSGGSSRGGRSSGGGGGVKLPFDVMAVTRTAFFLFFATHIPITIMLDAQVLLPAGLFPPYCQNLLAWYSEKFNDQLLSPPFDNVYFKSFVACELIFQLPFFTVALFELLTGKLDGNAWFRSACIAYGAHTGTTLLPILASISGSEASPEEKKVLYLLYLPYLVFPIWLVILAIRNESVFGTGKKKRY